VSRLASRVLYRVHTARAALMRTLIRVTEEATMLGDIREDMQVDSEFADEYQSFLVGDEGSPRSEWFDFPASKLARTALGSVSEQSTVWDAVERMRTLRTGSALITDPLGRLVGIFTERDLIRRVITAHRLVEHTQVAEVMTRSPDVLPATATVAQAVRFLARARYRHVPLVDGAQVPVAMLSARQLMGFISETFPKEVLNAPPESSPPIRRSEGA
jgi:CBS domain-containing protein